MAPAPRATSDKIHLVAATTQCGSRSEHAWVNAAVSGAVRWDLGVRERALKVSNAGVQEGACALFGDVLRLPLHKLPAHDAYATTAKTLLHAWGKGRCRHGVCRQRKGKIEKVGSTITASAPLLQTYR